MARLSCGVQCTRVILLILNVLFFIFGCVLLSLGIYLTVSKKLDVAFSDHFNTKIIGKDVLEGVGIIMITVAGFTLLLSTFGCFGAMLKNRGFLYLYAIILTFLILTEFAAVIATLVYRNRIRDSYKSGLKELFNEIYRNNHTDLEYVIEDIERGFKCCGVYNVSDYYNDNYTVPSSCYEKGDFHKSIYSKGCADAVIQWLWKQFPIVVGALFGILLIEIFGVVSSISLGTAIFHSRYERICN